MIKRLIPPLLVGALILTGCGGGGQEPPPPAPDQGIEAPLAKFAKPGNIQIPAIAVDSKIVPIPMDRNKKLTVESLDAEPMLTGWYERSAMPGQVGPVVLAGHVNYDGPGVFQRLHELKPGALVTVGDAADRVWTYKVTEVFTTPKTTFPTSKVYGRTDDEKLVLITCGGQFDSSRRVGTSRGSYLDNVIIIGTLI